jgi:hypothetical protein
MNPPVLNLWGAHAPRVLVGAPSRRRTSLLGGYFSLFALLNKFVSAEAPKPAREARALPR